MATAGAGGLACWSPRRVPCLLPRGCRDRKDPSWSNDPIACHSGWARCDDRRRRHCASRPLWQSPPQEKRSWTPRPILLFFPNARRRVREIRVMPSCNLFSCPMRWCAKNCAGNLLPPLGSTCLNSACQPSPSFPAQPPCRNGHANRQVLKMRQVEPGPRPAAARAAFDLTNCRSPDGEAPTMHGGRKIVIAKRVVRIPTPLFAQPARRRDAGGQVKPAAFSGRGTVIGRWGLRGQA